MYHYPDRPHSGINIRLFEAVNQQFADSKSIKYIVDLSKIVSTGKHKEELK